MSARVRLREPVLSSTTEEAPSTAGAHLGHVVFISAAAAMGGFLFGYDSAVLTSSPP